MTLLEAAKPLVHHRRWVRAVAVLQGALATLVGLTVLGLPLAAFLAWIAVVWWEAAQCLEEAVQASTPRNQELALRRALDRLAFQFVLQAILAGGTLVLMGVGRLWWSAIH